MKLLYCHYCQDVIRLVEKERTCACGKVKGRYINNLDAEYSGVGAVPIGFNNKSFAQALQNQPIRGLGNNFDAFVIPKVCSTFIKG